MKEKLFLLFGLIATSFYSCKTKGDDIIVKSTLIRTIDSTLESRTLIYDLSLTNNSNSRISFWIMNCSWAANWITNNDSFKIELPACDNDFPYRVNIDPNQSQNFNITVVGNTNTVEMNLDKARFGFFYFDADNNDSGTFLKYIERTKFSITRNDRNIIWEKGRNPIQFK